LKLEDCKQKQSQRMQSDILKNESYNKKA